MVGEDGFCLGVFLCLQDQIGDPVRVFLSLFRIQLFPAANRFSAQILLEHLWKHFPQLSCHIQ